jgi:acyl-CoA thioester hydrolase
MGRRSAAVVARAGLAGVFSSQSGRSDSVNPESEIRNPKQIQIQNTKGKSSDPDAPVRATGWVFDLGIVSDFVLRNSDFNFGVCTMNSGEIAIRVRYAETDRMGLLHHANYLVYFEQGRIELLRSQGLAYKDLEDQGFLLVLTRVQVRYRSPARYDDLLTLRTIVARTTLVKIEHRYEVLRDGLLLAEGESTLGCIDRDGKVQPLPEALRTEEPHV